MRYVFNRTLAVIHPARGVRDSSLTRFSGAGAMAPLRSQHAREMAPSLLQPQELESDSLWGESMSSVIEKPPTTNFAIEVTLDALLDDATVAESTTPTWVVIEGKAYSPHSNGGGLVSVAAYVGLDVYVAETARVEDSAIVLGAVRVLDRAVVRGCARVSGRCELRGYSVVDGFATLSGTVSMRHHARADGLAQLDGAVRMDYYAHVSRGQLYGPLLIE